MLPLRSYEGRGYVAARLRSSRLRGCEVTKLEVTKESYRIATRKGIENRRNRSHSSQATTRALRRLPLGSLRVFVAVAQHLSFTRAADSLGVSASAASLQIRALEEYLARPLFRRNGREVRLTNEGAALLPRIQRSLAELERAIDDVRLDRLAGPLRVTTLASFLQLWLLPRISRFRVTHPEVDLHMHTSAEVVDFVREEFHLAVRFGFGGWTNVHSEKLLDEWLVPVCAPALYAKYGPVHTLADLKRYPLVHSVSEPWTAWLFDGRADHPTTGYRGAVFDDSQAVVRVAIQGGGLALARWTLVADEIECGTLIAAARPMLFERSYWLVYPARVQELAGARAFMDWIRAEAEIFRTSFAVSSSFRG